MIRAAALLCALSVSVAQADSWNFSAPLDVAPVQPDVFHQLDSAGRKQLAVSGGTVALVWEESRAGESRVSAAFKRRAADSFSVVRVSESGNASLPVVAALADGRFVLAWEQDGDVWVRSGEPAGLGPALRLARNATQPSLAARGGTVLAVWSETVAGYARIRIARLKPNGAELRLVGAARDVDRAPARAEQQYPDVALTPSRTVVAWEDRRPGHTVLFYVQARSNLAFSAPRLLNEQPPKRSESYGKGTGVARVALAPHGRQGVVAVWLDKRNFLEGYDVFAGVAADGVRFGANEKVQDDFGSNVSQWHVAVAADGTGRVAAVWDDDRDGSADLWLAWRRGAGSWNENLAIPGAAGEGLQSNPVAVFDAAGRLHLAWIERAALEAPTRLRYLVADSPGK